MNKEKTASKHKALAILAVSLILLSLTSAISVVPKWPSIPEADAKTFYTDDEYFVSFTGTYTQWNNTYSYSSLSAIDSDGIGMNFTAAGSTAYQEGYWYISATNLPQVQTCVLYLYVKASSMTDQQLTLYNQTGPWFANVNGITSSYQWISINVTSTFNTKNKVVAMRLNFYDAVSVSSNSHLSINAAYLEIVGYVNVGYTYFKYDHNYAGQTCTFYCKIAATSGDLLSQYIISSDNNKNTGTYANGTAQSTGMVTTKNITWSFILNSTGDRFLDIKIYVKGLSGYWDVSNMYSFFIIPNGLTPDALWARLVFANDTNNVIQSSTATSPLIVNCTFPFLFSGSSSLSNVTTEGLLDNVFLYLQTGNTEFLRDVDLVAKWLNGTSELAYLWSTYTIGTG